MKKERTLLCIHLHTCSAGRTTIHTHEMSGPLKKSSISFMDADIAAAAAAALLLNDLQIFLCNIFTTLQSA